MTELEKAVKWLEHWKMVKECDARNYPHRTEHAEIADNCRVLLDALRWVPVSERLPESGNRQILVTGQDGEVDFAEYRYGERESFGYPVEFTHWMPLPQPPESEEIMKRFTKLLRIEYEDKWVVEDAFEDESGLIRGKAIDCLAQYETANEGLGCEECFGVAGMEIPLSTGIKSVNFCPICGRRF